MRRIQKEISRSKLSWPIMALITVVLWFIAWLQDHTTFLALPLLMTAGLFMMWINHLFALIRMFSRMIATCYLAFMAALIVTPDLSSVQEKSILLQLCIIGFLMLFFSCYQYRKAQGIFLYAFIAISIASLFFKQILFIVPLLWLLSIYCLVAFNLKIWLSSIFGIALPYLFLWCYYLLTNTPPDERALFGNWEFCHVFNFDDIPSPMMFAFYATSALSIFGIVHILREGHRDKVRTRMMYQIFISLAVFSFFMTLLQPQHIAEFTAIQIVPASAMLGHFSATTETKRSNAFFIFISIALAGIAIYNLH